MLIRSFRRWMLLGTSGFVCSCFIPMAQAEVRLVENRGFVVDASLTIGAGYFATANTNFGAGVTRSNGSVDDSADWGEGYVLPRLTGSYTGDIGQLYGGVAVVGSATLGETGDAGGFTPDDPSDVALEEFYVGWRSGTTIPGGEDVLDLSAGRQPFQIGDGFLIWDGNFDSGSKGAFWLAPRLSFKQTAIARVNVLPVRADLFYLDSDTDQGNTELAGVNVEFVEDERGTIGASYMHIIDSDFATRNGMDVYSIRGQGNPSLDVPDLFLAGEYAHQDNSNDGDSFAVDADAWYLEAGYQMSQVPWAPRLSYRFSHFSGDEGSSAEWEGFDPLFYGFSRGWGTWFMGEITGEYLLFNSNMDAHMVHISAAPRESIGIGAIYYSFDLDEPEAGISNPAGVGTNSDHFADEINLYTDLQITDQVSLSGVYAVAFPGAAAKDVFGDDEDYHLFEIYTTISF